MDLKNEIYLNGIIQLNKSIIMFHFEKINVFDSPANFKAKKNIPLKPNQQLTIRKRHPHK